MHVEPKFHGLMALTSSTKICCLHPSLCIPPAYDVQAAIICHSCSSGFTVPCPEAPDRPGLVEGITLSGSNCPALLSTSKRAHYQTHPGCLFQPNWTLPQLCLFLHPPALVAFKQVLDWTLFPSLSETHLPFVSQLSPRTMRFSNAVFFSQSQGTGDTKPQMLRVCQG